MFLGIFKVLLSLQLISIALVVADEQSSEPIEYGDEDTDDDVKHQTNIELNVDLTYNAADKEKKTVTSKTTKQKSKTTKKSFWNKIKNKKKRKKRIFLAAQYALPQHELGFDLTPEEMKKFNIWKDGIIPYYIDVVSFSDKGLRDKIRNFLQMVNSATSVNFVELPGPPSDDKERWVFFINRRGLLGCTDHTVKNFTNQGVQQVVLGYDCMATRGELAEAVMSILGIPAQHNAPDRDNYIKVNMDNIMPDKKYLFEKLKDNEWLFHDLAYDFDSVTHYDIHKYSANGRATIQLKKTSDDLYPATEFSSTDLMKIKMLYNFLAGNKKIQSPICDKLFKFNGKLASLNSLEKGLQPRNKPNKYLGISSSDPITPNKKTTSENVKESYGNNNQNKGNNDIKDIKNGESGKQGDNEDEDTFDKDVLNENDKIVKRPLKAYVKKDPRNRLTKATTDLINQLSDYDSREYYKKIGSKTTSNRMRNYQKSFINY